MTAVDAAVAADDPRARQLAAIEESGWGERFKLFQPRNALFWLFAWALVVGVVHTVNFYRQDVANYGGALVGGGVAFAIYGGLWLLFLGAANRYTPESPKLLAVGFLWGFFVATAALALTINDAVLGLYTKAFGQSWTSDWGAGLTAPFTEETAKALGFVVLLGLAPRLIRSAYDAFVVGAFIGLRSLVGIASHALFSAIFCTGLFWLLGWGAEQRRVAKGLGLMVLAMVCHGVWDDTGAIGVKLIGDAGAGILMPVFLIIEVVIILWVARLASSTEKTWMRDLLGPEVASGTITAAEADALAGSRHHQRKYVKTIHGHHERRTTKHVLEAAHDLAAEIARAHGEETDAVVFARSEVTRLRTA